MGPLTGLRVLEFAGIGPGPFCGMLLSDLGATVIRLDRRDGAELDPRDFVGRGRRSITLDLKRSDAVATALRLVAGADALIEGFRPGVMERIGLGPEPCFAANPRLVYGRMTGWGQAGPLAPTAGHDLNYIAITGALWAMGRPDGPPAPPLNLIGDYGGGGLLLAFGLLAALLEAQRSGRGQVVDAAMSDGAALLMAPIYAMLARGRWANARGANMLDGAAPWYDSYACADGGYVAVGPIEPQFFAAMLAKLELDPAEFPDRMAPSGWPKLRAALTERFASRSRDAWAEIFAGTDACVAPVLDLAEAPRNPHNVARGTFLDRGMGPEPAPAPRFSRTEAVAGGPPPARGADTAAVLAEFGFSAAEIEALAASGAT